MAYVVCEVRPGLRPEERWVIVKDAQGRRQSLRVNHDFLTREGEQYYLPIGVVHRSADQILIELPHEADSGASRLWVPPSDLH